MKNQRKMLYLQGLLGLSFVIVGMMGSSYKQMQCDKKTQRCLVKIKIFGYHAKNYTTYNTQSWQSTSIGKKYDSDRKTIYYVIISKGKKAFRLSGFDTRKRSIVNEYEKTIRNYIKGKNNSLTMTSRFAYGHYFFLIVFFAGGLWLLYATFRGEVLEDG